MSNPIADPWGFVLIGVFLSLVLFGILVSQVFTYFRNCDKDPLWQKIFVLILFALDTLSSILAVGWMYWLQIKNWGQIEAFTYGNWFLAIDPMVAGIIGCMVQCFFARQIHNTAGKGWLTMVILFCAFATVCGGIGSGIASFWVKSYALFANFNQIVIIWLVSAAVCNIVITLSLTFHLRRYKGKLDATDKVVNRIIQITVQNGLLTALVVICGYVPISVYPYPLPHITVIPYAKAIRQYRSFLSQRAQAHAPRQVHHI